MASDSAMYEAIKEGNVEEARRLINRGANVNSTHGPLNNSLLMFAIEAGSFQLAMDLCPLIRDVNHRNAQGQTALMLAAGQDFTDLIRLLIVQGASLDEQDDGGRTALALAVLEGHQETVELLLGFGADPNVMDGNSATVLMLASSIGDVECIRLLVGAGATVDRRDRQRSTCLHYAVYRNHFDAVGVLLEHGADPKLADSNGETPLMLAKRLGLVESINTLQHA